MRIVGVPAAMQYLARILKKERKEAKIELSEIAELKLKIVEFGLKHGYKAVVEAFGISKSTYYNYVKKYKRGRPQELEPLSRKPKKVRTTNWDKRLVRFIRVFRQKHPNIGKSKIKYYLDKYCKEKGIRCVSTGTIQNIINSFPCKLRTKKSVLARTSRTNVIRKPAKYKAKSPGECTSLDSVEFRRDGKKAYVVTVIDEVTNLLFAQGTYSHSSRTAKEILESAYDYLPWENFSIILTDNGSEFAKDFAKYIKEQDLTHYHTYPKTPKQNARCERVNRTIQDEFMLKYGSLLFDDIHKFNRKLREYLHWYNFKRVHYRFGNKLTPYEKFQELASGQLAGSSLEPV